MVEINKVSVVTIVEKGVRFYITALKSFIYQSYQNTEWIIIDNTGYGLLEQRLEKYTSKHKKICVISNKISLPKPLVLKQAFDLSQGDYIAFLNPADYWVKDKISRQVAVMMRYKAPLCHTSYAFADDKYHLLPIGCYHTEKSLNMVNYTKQNPVSLSTLMLSKNAFVDFSKLEYASAGDEMSFFLNSGIVSSGMSDVLTLCRPLFDKQTRQKVEALIAKSSTDSSNADLITSRILEHYVHLALNVEGLKLDPMIYVGYDVIKSLKKLKNFKM